MHTDDLWLLTVLLWLGAPWLSAYLISEITSLTCLTIPARLLVIITTKKITPIDAFASTG